MKIKSLVLILSFCFLTIAKEYNEDNIIELVAEYLPENPIIIEAGAHFGEDTQKMSKLWPKGIIHAFEPLPFSFEKVKQACCNLSNVRMYQCALADCTKKEDFWVCTNRAGASSLLQPTEMLKTMLKFKSEPITVQCYKLDDWAVEHGIDCIDFMWLDMEGFELAMLKASPNILKTVKAIYTEVNYLEFRQNNAFYAEIKEFLEQNGFEQVWWKQSRQFMRHNGPLQANVLFVRI